MRTRHGNRSSTCLQIPGQTAGVVAVLLFLVVSLMSGGASASVDSELTFHRGVVAYGEGRFEDARASFELVLESEPDDASALQYLGLIANKNGDKEAAIDYFRRAVNADPDDLEIRHALGVSLLHLDRADEAGIEFSKILRVEPDNAEAEFYAGVAKYRRQKFEETVAHMYRAAELDPALRLQARYYTGLAETFMGNLDASVAAFSDAASLSPGDPLSISASILGEQIARPDSGPFGFDLKAGIQYDSNPTFIGGIVVPGSPPPGNRQDDAVGTVALNAHVDVIDWQQITFRVGYSGFLSAHGNAKEVNQFTNYVWGDVGLRVADFRIGVRFDLGNTSLDLDNDFRNLRRVTPSLTYSWNDFGVTQLLYQYYDIDYSVPSLAALDPDGELHTFGVSQYIFMSAPFTYAVFGVGYEKSDTEGSEFDYEGVELNAGFGAELPYHIQFSFLARYLFNDYDNLSQYQTDLGDPFPGKKREDHIARININFAYPLGQFLEVSLEGSLDFNTSNVEGYDVDRHVVGTYVTYTF